MFLVKTHDVKKTFVKVNFVARSVIRIDKVEANKSTMMTRQKTFGGKSSEMALAKKNLKVAVPPTEGDSVFVFGIVRQTILPPKL